MIDRRRGAVTISDVRGVAGDRDLGGGRRLRGILTGGSQAPDLNKIMTAIGREETLGRLDDALAVRA
ncbi:MAG: hypothetical protein K2Y05_00420 [Hyphomicrobiaceae bacterium]|nr:hypothetical protein [Hyphomicrobiaceae bacterium]